MFFINFDSTQSDQKVGEDIAGNGHACDRLTRSGGRGTRVFREPVSGRVFRDSLRLVGSVRLHLVILDGVISYL